MATTMVASNCKSIKIIPMAATTTTKDDVVVIVIVLVIWNSGTMCNNILIIFYLPSIVDNKLRTHGAKSYLQLIVDIFLVHIVHHDYCIYNKNKNKNPIVLYSSHGF